MIAVKELRAIDEVEPMKWQPAMLIAPHRVECGSCRALAIFVILEHNEVDGYTFEAWCQSCFEREQEK